MDSFHESGKKGAEIDRFTDSKGRTHRVIHSMADQSEDSLERRERISQELYDVFSRNGRKG